MSSTVGNNPPGTGGASQLPPPDTTLDTSFNMQELNENPNVFTDEIISAGIAANQTEAQSDIDKAQQYLKDSGSPALPGPNPFTTGQTFTTSQKIIVLMNYHMVMHDQIKEILVNHQPPLSEDQIKELVNNLPELDDLPSDVTLTEDEKNQLQAKNTQVITAISGKYGLPSSWTPKSSSQDDWTNSNTPSPPEPYDANDQANILTDYDGLLQQNLDALSNAPPVPAGITLPAGMTPPLTADQMEVINQLVADPNATVTGATQGLKDLAAQITQTTTQTIQNKYDLPDTWTANATSVSDWTPVNLINPFTRAGIEGKIFAMNTLTQINDIYDAAKNLIDSLPENTADQIAYKDFLKATLLAIQKLKNLLYQMQASKADKIQGQAEDQKELLDIQRANAQEAFEKAQEQEEEQRKAEEKAKEMSMWIGIASILLCAIAIIAAPFTGGASVALMVVAVAMLALTVADFVVAQTSDSGQGFIASGMATAMKELQEALPASFPSWASDAIACAIAVAVAIIIAVVTMGAGAAADAGILGAVGVTVAETATMLATQVVIQLIIASGAIEVLIGEIVKASGADDADMQWITTLITVILILMIVVLGGVQAAKGAGAINKAAGSTTKEASSLMSKLGTVSKVIQGAGILTAAGAEIYAGVASIQEGKIYLEMAKITREKAQFEAANAYIGVILGLIKTLMKNLASGAGGQKQDSDLANALNTLQNTILKDLSQTMTQLGNISA